MNMLSRLRARMRKSASIVPAASFERVFGVSPKRIEPREPIPADMIDVRAVIEAKSPAEHIALAEQYFAAMADPAPVLRKPFTDTESAREICMGLASLLSEMRLFRGCRVLDYGAGMGWLSRILASLGCDVVALDVSRTALLLGKSAVAGDAAVANGRIDWVQFDGHSVPLPDESFDRVVCFDAFHHVADQQGTLAEMARLLRAGGIALFHEPGPRHSLSAPAQEEMRRFGVIENDIYIEEIEAAARTVGLDNARLAFYARFPVMLEVADYLAVVRGTAADERYATLGKMVAAQMSSLRVFLLRKPGEVSDDSRGATGLLGLIAVHSVRIEGYDLHLEIDVTNTGSRAWLPSGNETGAVNLGFHLMLADGREDFAWRRAGISQSMHLPGQTRRTSINLVLPANVAALKADLVAEHVVWFAGIGNPPVTIPLPDVEAASLPPEITAAEQKL